MTQTLPSPITAAMLAPANAAAGYPRYNTPGDWAVGNAGSDAGRPDAVNAAIATSKATVALASASGGVAAADYAPRSQNAKLSLNSADGRLCMGSISGSGTVTANVAAPDIGRDRGWIAPNQPYQGNASAPAAPVVTSISPTTGTQASLPLLVTITGTGFTPYSKVFTGGTSVPDGSAKYVDATHMTVPIWAAAPGTVSVAVEDHSLLSNTNVVFTVT
jgi:hypothetical protein